MKGVLPQNDTLFVLASEFNRVLCSNARSQPHIRKIFNAKSIEIVTNTVYFDHTLFIYMKTFIFFSLKNGKKLKKEIKKNYCQE